MQIAVIDNDPRQRDTLVAGLGAAGHEVRVFADEVTLVAAAREGQVSLLVFHWQPEAEGLKRLVATRPAVPYLPLLLVTGRAQSKDFFDLLAAGCCDYLIKPVRQAEVAMRAGILLHRAEPAPLDAKTVEFDHFVFDLRSEQLTDQGQPITLTQKEFRLALLFFRNLGRPLSRATILESVWAQDTGFNSRTMDTHVSRVRTKLGLKAERGYRLAPVYSYGYRLEKLGD